MSDMKAYLAERYMSGPKRDAILARSTDPAIKKKRKKPKNEDYIGGSASTKGESSGLVMRDEDEWKREQDADVDGEDAPIVGKGAATFQKSKNTWATVGSTSLPVPPAAAGPSSRPDNDADPDIDIKPDPDAEASAAPPAAPAKQLTKRKGGLRTAAQLREEAERAAAERGPSPPAEEAAGPSATVHRDASGRILDVEKLKAEAKSAEEEERRKEKEREEWSKGLVQRKKQRDRIQEEMDMDRKDVARYADDAAMNREMRQVERWNDPAAEFLTKKKRKGPRRPTYKGAWQPNRFGIPPGFRWDGVDRSNGFEKKYFQHQNTVARRDLEATKWGMEDM